MSYETRNALEYKYKGIGVLKIADTDFSLGEISWGSGKLGQDTPTYKDMRAACEKTAGEGCFSYEDPFVWGKEMSQVLPETIFSLRERFPIIFIDEAQDNSELQSDFLHRVFIEDDTTVVCQRFGDANQAIYHGMNSKESPKTWGFPVSVIKHEIQDSYRFGSTIAKLAEPLGVEPQSLKGRGPDTRKVKTDVDGQHTVFLFDEQACKHVLPAYAAHLQDNFSVEDLEKGSFVAVGAIRSEWVQGAKKNPKPDVYSVCD